MTRLSQLVAISRATKLAYDSSTDPDERKQLHDMGVDIANMIGAHVAQSNRMRNSNTSTEQTS